MSISSGAAEPAGPRALPLHVRASGAPDGPPLVLLHGVGNSGRTYDFLPPAVTDRWRVLAVDLRGHGSSPRAAGAYTLDDYVADVAALLHDTGPAVVVGHSLGGVIAWTLAGRYPDLVTAALLEDPPLYRGEPAEHAANGAVPLFRMLRERLVGWQADGTEPAVVAAAMGAAPTGPGHAGRTVADVQRPETLEQRARSLLDADPAVLDAVIDATSLAGIDTTGPVTVPVVMIAADEDAGGVFAERDEARLAASHPDVVVHRLPGAGHGIHDEIAHRDTWLAQLAAVLDSHAAP